MSRLTTIAAAAFVTAGALSSAPSIAAELHAGISGRDAAASECLSFNKYGPAELVATAEDGLGDWIVWVRDKDEDLWMCNASADGNVYVNKLIRGDLLHGAGERVIALQPVAQTASDASDKAEQVCAAAGRKVDATRILANVFDGVGDRIVWLQGNDHSYWVCNASDEAKLYVFERVRAPINAGAAGPDFRAA